MKTLTVDRRVKDFLTDAEIGQFLTAAKLQPLWNLASEGNLNSARGGVH